jgi:hypothetical protein
MRVAKRRITAFVKLGRLVSMAVDLTIHAADSEQSHLMPGSFDLRMTNTPSRSPVNAQMHDLRSFFNRRLNRTD